MHRPCIGLGSTSSQAREQSHYDHLTKPMSTKRIAFFCVLILWTGMGLSLATSQTIPTPAIPTIKMKPAESGEIEIMIRFSKGLFESLTKHNVEMKVPIDRTVDGMKVSGQADGKGVTEIRFDESQSTGEFIIKVPGSADVSFQGDAGPATAHATSVVQFDTSKKIRFDGRVFTQGATTTESRGSTCVTRICPRRSGLIGRLVKRIGWRMARKSICDVNRQVEKVANEILRDTFDERATELITELNDIHKELHESQFQATLQKYFPNSNSFDYQLQTLPDSIIAAVGAPNAKLPKLPPAKSHIEIWLKTRPLEATFLELMVEWNVAHDLLKEYLPAEEAKLIAEDLKVETVDGWSVLRVGWEESP